MLQKLNERIQGIFAWIIIALIAITFTFFGLDYYFQASDKSRKVVSVNGEDISTELLEIQFKRASQNPTIQRKPSKQEILERLIKTNVSVQAALKNGFFVSLNEANQAILSIPDFQEDGRFSPTRFAQAISNALFTTQSFQNEVRQSMLLNQQRFAFMGTEFVLPNEVEEFIKLYFQTRDYSYFVIPTKAFFKPAEISASEIEKYYNKNRNKYMSPELVSLEYVTLSIPKNKSSEESEQAQKIYLQKLDQLADLSYQTPDSLDNVVEELKLPRAKTELFSRLGGNTKITQNKKIILKAFSSDILNEKNNSQPIQLDDTSAVVIRLNQHILPKQQSLAEVSNIIRQQLARVRARILAEESANSLLKNNAISSWQNIKAASRESSDLYTELAFSQADLKPMLHKLENGDFVIIKINKINYDQNKIDAEKQKGIAQQLEANYGALIYNLYINQLVKNAKIKH